ncbi:hypothetical protein M0804_015575 [Polistes exclamans]|nr:hypothetical protein M0804_015575 [Polistes exclamans]
MGIDGFFVNNQYLYKEMSIVEVNIGNHVYRYDNMISFCEKSFGHKVRATEERRVTSPKNVHGLPIWVNFAKHMGRRSKGTGTVS